MLLVFLVTAHAQVEPNYRYDVFNQRIENFVEYADVGYFERLQYPTAKVDFLLDERYLIEPILNHSRGRGRKSSFSLIFTRTFDDFYKAFPEDPDATEPLKFIKNKIIETCIDALLAETTINCQVIAIDLISIRKRHRRSDEYQLKAPWWPPSPQGPVQAFKMSDGRKIGVSVSAIR